MSKQANKKAIGAFVVVSLALAVAAIIIFGSGKFFVEKNEFVAYFQGSVNGLSVGAPVLFRGVKIGEVTQIMIYADPRNQTFEIPVIMEIEPGSFKHIGPEIKNRKQWVQELIKRGLRAQLQMQSMVTGQLMINIDFYPNTPVRLVENKQIGLPKDVIEIPTIQTGLQKLESTLQEIPIAEMADSLNTSMKRISEILSSEDVSKSLLYFRQTMQDVSKLANRLEENMEPLLSDARQTLKEAQVMMHSVNTQVDPLATSLKQTSDTATATLKDAQALVNHLDGRIKPLAEELTETLKHADRSLQAAQETLATVNATLTEGSPLRYELGNMLDQMARAASSLRALAQYLEQNPAALIRGRAERGTK
jgi:paraquat-inducible protein B